MAVTELPIGALAEATGCNVQTIRFYERIGLIDPPPRTAGGQRRYDLRAAHRLEFIRHARALGFEVAAIRELLDLADQPERSCAEADRIARGHLEAVRAKIARLTALESELARMVAACGEGRIADCRVIEVLGDHGQCAAPHPGPAAEPAVRRPSGVPRGSRRRRSR